MPEIAVAPLPVAPAPSPSAKSPAPESKAPSAKAAQGSQDSADAAGHADSAAKDKDPFAAVLQRMVKNAKSDGQSKDGKDAANPLDSLMNTEAAASPQAAPTATPTDVMAQVLAQMGQLAQDGTSPKQKAAAKSDDDEKGENAPLAAITPQVTASNLPDQGKQNPSGSDVASLAARPAILATEQGVSDTAKHHGSEENADFHNLLTAAQATQQQSVADKQTTGSKPELPVQTPVGQQNWDQEVGDKLVWMAGKQASKAELVLTPPHMGRVEVSITVSGDQANASFVSANPAVRDALEAALPRLREVLADAGVRLDQAQVGADNRGNSAQDQERRDNRGHDKSVTGEFIPGLATTTSSGAGVWTRRGNGMVDTFV